MSSCPLPPSRWKPASAHRSPASSGPPRVALLRLASPEAPFSIGAASQLGRFRASSERRRASLPSPGQEEGVPMLYLFAVAVAFGLTAAPAGAQPSTAPEPMPRLPPMVVPESPYLYSDRTATTEESREQIQRTVPGGAEVIGERNIRDSLAENLRGVLDFVPGVLVRPMRASSPSGAPGSRTTSTAAT